MNIEEKKHIGYECEEGCKYGIQYFKCPEHFSNPVAKIFQGKWVEEIYSDEVELEEKHWKNGTRRYA